MLTRLFIRFMLCCLLATLLQTPHIALAQGKVTKQKNCAVLIDGISGGAVGDTVPILGPDGKKYNARIVKVAGSKAQATIQGGQCPNIVTGTVGRPSSGGGGGGSGGASGSSSGSTGGGGTSGGSQTPNTFGAKLLLGYSFITIKAPVGDVSSIRYSGLDFMVGGHFTLGVGPVGVPIELGVARFSNSVIINSEIATGTEVTTRKDTQTVTELLLHFGSGVVKSMGPLGISSILFVEYGLSGELKSKGDTGDVTAKTKSLMRYGLDVGVDYGIVAGLRTGLDFTYFMGSIKSDGADKSYPLSGYGIFWKLGYDL